MSRFLRWLFPDRAMWDLANMTTYSRLRNSGLSYCEAWAEMDRLYEAGQ